MMIAELRTRVEGHDDAIGKLETRVGKHDEIIAELRTAIASVATKDDILSLSRNIDEKFNRQLRDAHNSIPAWIGLMLTAGSVIVAVITLAHHG